MKIVIPLHVSFRAATRCRPDGQGCLISVYSTASHGYAQIGWHGTDGIRRGTIAHRAAWSLAYGQIPDGMTVDHMCKKRPCVRLSHLRLLPNYENARRTNGRDWPLGQCANGHPNSELFKQPSGRVRCRTCTREAAQRSNWKRRGTPQRIR